MQQQQLKREIIRVPGMVPGRASDTSMAPIPDGARIGNIVASSLIPGLGPDADAQATAMFGFVRSFMEQVGGTPENIIQMTVYLGEESQRPFINREWLKMFPDPNNRPARIVTYRDFTQELGVGRRQAEQPPDQPRRGPMFEVAILAVLPA